MLRILGKRAPAILAAALITGLSLAVPATPAAAVELADPPERERICPPGERECSIGDEDDSGSGGGGNGSGSGGGGGACLWHGPVGNNPNPPVVTASGSIHGSTQLVNDSSSLEIPCRHDEFGWWHNGDQCYYGEFPAVHDIDLTPPEGKTEEDGRYYYLTCPAAFVIINGVPEVDSIFGSLRWAWVDFVDVPEATPVDVAMQWLARIGLDGVEFQLAPPETGAGLVGLPVWLGVAEGDTVWGPIHDDDCIGSVCVDISAQVTSVAWQMGDGDTVTCTADQHVTWQPGMDFRNPGQRCHHEYHRASRHLPDQRYEITAVSTWAVTWEDASGNSDVITTERTSTTSLRIDEIQVLRSR